MQAVWKKFKELLLMLDYQAPLSQDMRPAHEAWNRSPRAHHQSEQTLIVWPCGALKKATKVALGLQVAGKRCPGCPKLTWKMVIECDCRLWGLTTTDPLNRDSWRQRTKTAMRCATQSTGSGGALMWTTSSHHLDNIKQRMKAMTMCICSHPSDQPMSTDYFNCQIDREALN